MKKTLFSFVLILCLSGLSFAAPNLINYQGTLTDGVGQPINGDVSVEFRLFDTEVDGNLLWSETQSVAVQNGSYNVLLGSVSPFPSDLFANNTLWLEIVAAGETMAPRQQLVSVPYALRSASTDCIPGDALICYSGPSSTRDTGACKSGLRICGQSGSFENCSGEILPATEVCDSVDNDCNGLTDDNASDATPWYADADSDGFGDINSEVIACVAPQDFIAIAGDCDDTSGYVNESAIEICDGFDNDCNAIIDDNCSYPPACTTEERSAFESCLESSYGLPADAACLDLPGYSLGCRRALSSLFECMLIYCAYYGDVTTVCGNSCLNDSQQAYVSAYVSATPDCTAGQTQSCGTTDVGECSLGTQNCLPGGWWEEGCPGSVDPVPEICGDGLDNDCDGIVDFDLQTDANNCGVCGYVCPVGEICSSGVCQCPVGQADCGSGCIDLTSDPSNCGACGNVCSDSGYANVSIYYCASNSCQISTCSPGWYDLNGIASDGCEEPCGTVEICGDGLDNDCDGTADTHCSASTCDVPHTYTPAELGTLRGANNYKNSHDPFLTTGACTGLSGEGLDAIFSFTPIESAYYMMSTAGSTGDTVLYVLSDCSLTESCLAGVNDAAESEILHMWLEAGVTYYIVLDDTCAFCDPYYALTIDFSPDGTPCDDGNLCTTGDTVTGGVCGGTPVDCSAYADQCNDATCNPGSGSCDIAPLNGASCDDANQSTYNDTCDAGGVCTGTPYTCTPSLACMTSTPDGQGGCTETINAGFCAVGGACYADGQLVSSCEECDSAVSQTSGVSLPMGSPCGDQTDNACTNPDTCDAGGICQPNHEPVSTECRPTTGICDIAETCDGNGNCPADDFQPVSFVCRTATGSCDITETCDGVNPNCPADNYAAGGTNCDDANPLTLNDQCDGSGICAGTPAIVNWCMLLTPTTITGFPASDSVNIFGQVYAAGLTDLTTGNDTPLFADVGYGPQGTDPSGGGWLWTSASQNAGYSGALNDDEYVGSFKLPVAGSYDYAYRFSVDGSTYVYCDTNGTFDGYDAANAGKMTVNP